MGERSDAELIAASVDLPREFGVVFDRHFGSIHRYLARRMSAADADELAGEVFRIAFEQRLRFDTGRESALPWLYGIASNLVLKHRRRATRALRALAREASAAEVDQRARDEFTAVDSRLDAARSRGLVVSALRSLSAVDRELVLLAAFSELTSRELAEATGLPEGTVKSKLSRAKAKLRERIEGSGELEAGPHTNRLIGGQA